MKLPHYTICVAGYYDPNGDPDEVVRFSAAVVDLRTDETVESKIYKQDIDIEAATDDFALLGAKYSTGVTMLTEMVPLETCPCCPDGILLRVIRKADYLAAQHDKHCRG